MVNRTVHMGRRKRVDDQRDIDIETITERKKCYSNKGKKNVYHWSWYKIIL